MSTSTSWQTLIPEIAKKVYAGKEVIIVTGTGTANSTVVDSTRAYTTRSAYSYDGMGFYAYNNGAGSGPEDEFRRVTKGGFTSSSGSWAIAPNWGSAAEAGDLFILMRGGLDINQFLDAANAVITSHFWPRYLPYCGTLNDNDGDMETSGTSAYTSLSGATLAKDTTDVYSGAQSLSVATNASGEGVQSAVFGHHETGTLLVYALVRTSLALSVVLYDETNSTAVQTVTVSANETVSTTADEWTLVMFQQAPPSSSTSLSIRITTSEATSNTWFVDHIGVLPSTNHLFKIPTSVADVSHLDSLMYMSALHSARDNETYVLDGSFRDWEVGQSLKDYAGVNSHRFTIDPYPQRPVWIKFRATESALTGLSSTTFADTDVIEYGAATELVERWINNLRSPPATLVAKRNRLHSAYVAALNSIEVGRPDAEFKPLARVRVP